MLNLRCYASVRQTQHICVSNIMVYNFFFFIDWRIMAVWLFSLVGLYVQCVSYTYIYYYLYPYSNLPWMVLLFIHYTFPSKHTVTFLSYPDTFDSSPLSFDRLSPLILWIITERCLIQRIIEIYLTNISIPNQQLNYFFISQANFTTQLAMLVSILLS